MKKSLLLAFACLFLMVSCEKENVSKDSLNTTSSSFSKKAVITEVDFNSELKALLKNDSVLFTMMLQLNKAKAKSKPDLKKSQNLAKFQKEGDLHGYMNERGYDADKYVQLIQENTQLLSAIKEKRGVDFSLDENDSFNLLYSVTFKEMMNGNTGEASANKVDPGGSGACADAFVDAWNTNAANYRKNAQACYQLPGPIGLICVTLAGESLDRQQEAAFNSFQICTGNVKAE